MKSKAIVYIKSFSIELKKNRVCLAIVVFLSIGTTLSPQSLAQEGCQESLLPVEVRKLLVSNYRAWRILRLSDLISDDQQIWINEHPKECPGIAVGHFRNSKDLSYAVTLVRQEQGKRYQLLLIAEKALGNTYSLKLLNKPTEVSAFSVVMKMPPGPYSNYDESRNIVTKFDSIVYAKLESGAMMYYWRRNVYRSMQVSI